MAIPEDMYKAFLADPDNVGEGQSKGEALKIYLLNNLPTILYQDWRKKVETGEESRSVAREDCNIAVV